MKEHILDLEFPSEDNYVDTHFKLSKKFIIHANKSSPLGTDQKNILNDFGIADGKKKSYLIKIYRKQIIGLPSPYETNCQEYGHQSRFDCLNQCYYKKFKLKLGCLPPGNNPYTFILKTIYLSEVIELFNFKDICQFVDYNNHVSLVQELERSISKICNNICKKACIETLFTNDYHLIKVDRNSSMITIKLGQSYYTIVKHEPSTTLVQTFINIINVCSLLHGVNIVYIVWKIIKIIINISYVRKISRSLYMSKLKIKKFIKVYCLLTISLFLLRELFFTTIEYFEYNSILRIGVKNNHDEIGQVSMRLTFMFEANKNDVDKIFSTSTNESIISNNMNQNFSENGPFIIFWDQYVKSDLKFIIEKLGYLNNEFNENFQINFNNDRGTLMNNMSMMKTSGFMINNEDNIDDKNRHYFVTFDLIKFNMNEFININFKKYIKIKSTWKLTHIFIHSDLFPNFNEIFYNEFNLYYENFTLVLAKTVRQYMDPPVGHCSRYSVPSAQTFNAESHIQCYRKCYRYLVRKDLNCTLLTMDYSFNMLDFNSLDENLCDSHNLHYYNNIYKKTKIKTIIKR